MKRKAILNELARIIAVNLVVFAVIECVIRGAYFIRDSMVEHVPLPYVIAGDYGPSPPWLDRRSLLNSDKTLVWRSQPNFRRKFIDIFSPVRTEDELKFLRHSFFPTLPASLKDNPVWEVSLNSEGFRDAEFPQKKPSSAFRIICLGDSWTFGANVGQNETYPEHLGALLRQEFPTAHFEVFNLGVLGYAAYNGLQLLKTRALDLNPDLVVLGFAMNEPNMAGYRNEGTSTDQEPITLMNMMGRVWANIGSFASENIEFYRFLRYWALHIKWQPKSIGDHFKSYSQRLVWVEQQRDYGELEPWMQVSLREYEQYLLEMINLVRRKGAGVVLVYNEFWREGPYRRVLEKIAKAEEVPLVDSSALLFDAQRRIEEDVEAKLKLQPSNEQRITSQGETKVIFRVYQGKRSVPKAIYIVGTHEMLGNLVPNTVAMYDDGTHNDQRAGDGVWSYTAAFPPGTVVFYTYTNSGAEGKWEGLDVPVIRRFNVETTKTGLKVYAPIDTFGKMYMHADPWHTDASGYELIAKHLLEVMKGNEKVQAYLRRVTTDGR
jgi:lysophospholipase L1-like esterase